MEVQEYTFAQVASQLQRAINENKATVALHDMMVKAAQAETYLAEHEATAARIEEALDAQRALLVESAEAYKELQESIQAEKNQHAATKRAFTLDMKKHVQACEDKVEQATTTAAYNYDALTDATEAHRENMEYEQEIATASLELIYVTLEEADKKLAALRESL